MAASAGFSFFGDLDGADSLFLDVLRVLLATAADGWLPMPDLEEVDGDTRLLRGVTRVGADWLFVAVSATFLPVLVCKLRLLPIWLL